VRPCQLLGVLTCCSEVGGRRSQAHATILTCDA
jgi:hypothetical protein